LILIQKPENQSFWRDLKLVCGLILCAKGEPSDEEKEKV
jgi:hypothetical protein